MTDLKCRGCGATIALPEDLSVLSLRCEYCGAQQPPPDLDARRAHVERLRAEERAQAEREEAEKRAEERSEEEEQEREAARRERLRGVRRRAVWRWARTQLVRIGLLAAVVAVLSWLGKLHVGILATSWDGKTPFRCSGVGRVRLSEPRADMPGTAIEAGPYCWVVLERPRVVADVAAAVKGFGRLIVRGGELVGRKQVAVLSDDAVLRNEGGTLQGALQVGDRARVEGTAVWDGRSSIDCTSGSRLTIAAARAALGERSQIRLRRGCELHLDGVELSGGAGPLIEVHDRAVLFVTGGRIGSTGVAILIADEARVVNNDGAITGRVRRQGRGRFEGREPLPPPVPDPPPPAPSAAPAPTPRARRAGR